MRDYHFGGLVLGCIEKPARCVLGRRRPDLRRGQHDGDVLAPAAAGHQRDQRDCPQTPGLVLFLLFSCAIRSLRMNAQQHARKPFKSIGN